MARDLASGAGEVHAAAAAVLDFWLRETPPGLRFAKDAALDAAIAERFGGLHDRLVASGAAGWADESRTLLAAVIAIDQFGRNLYRGQARAFAGDPLALSLTRHALAQGWDAAMTAEERVFLYLPLMHSEDPAVQADSVAAFTALGIAENMHFATAHRDVIARFGRFPGRNAALGRTSTPAEQDYLSQPGAGW